MHPNGMPFSLPASAADSEVARPAERQMRTRRTDGCATGEKGVCSAAKNGPEIGAIRLHWKVSNHATWRVLLSVDVGDHVIHAADFLERLAIGHAVLRIGAHVLEELVGHGLDIHGNALERPLFQRRLA